MTRQELYRAAIEADDAFSATLVAQGFASRWDSHRLIMANKATRAAYLAKLDADEALWTVSRFSRARGRFLASVPKSQRADT